MARDVILLQSMGGTDFSLQPGQLVECNPDEADRFIETGTARALVKGEPTAIQEANRFSFVDHEKRLKRQSTAEEYVPASNAPEESGKPKAPRRSRVKKSS